MASGAGEVGLAEGGLQGRSELLPKSQAGEDPTKQDRGQDLRKTWPPPSQLRARAQGRPPRI